MPKVVDRDEQRREIATQAAKWIAKRGLETLSLRSVAGAHGCSKGMVQHYFTDKEELLFGALQYVTEEYENRALKATKDLTGLSRIERRFAVILPLDEALRDEWVVRLAFYARAALVPQMQRYLHDHVGRALRQGVRELRECQQNAEVLPGVNLVRAYRTIMAVVAGIAVSEIVSPRFIAPSLQRRMLHEAVEAVRAK
jgi:AcrR family transcriptional regulator